MFQRLEVFSDVDLYAGSVIQEWNMTAPMFQLTNSSGTVMFRLIGPKSAITCCPNNYQAKFDVSIALNIANICSFHMGIVVEFSYTRMEDLQSVPTLM